MSDITIYVADSIELATFLFATENWLASNIFQHFTEHLINFNLKIKLLFNLPEIDDNSKDLSSSQLIGNS